MPQPLVFPPDGQIVLPLAFEPQVLRYTTASPGGHSLIVLIRYRYRSSAIDQGAASDAVPFTETAQL